MKAIVLLSGGMDSATAVAQAIADGSQDTLCMAFKYGSRHSEQEIRSAYEVVSYYQLKGDEITYLPIRLPEILFKGSGSALMGESDVPKGEYHDPEKETPSATVVPFRNANMISAAVAMAEGHGYDRVYIAIHATDAQGFAYPDCTPEFVGAMTSAVYIGTHRKVRLQAPFQWMSKSEIVTRAAELMAPLHLTWSCYRGESKQCGQCPTCIERIKAFGYAGYIDPVGYATDIQWSLNQKPFPIMEGL
jgi:7-cyano-7-deazaguanine synthase